MSKSKQDKKNQIIPYNEIKEIQEIYNNELENNIKYSLEVDPENKYNMTDEQKQFVKLYVDFKNVRTVAEVMKIKQDRANEIFLAYSVQSEVRRINLALYHRQFSSRLISLDEIGGYLTSLLVGINTPLADQPRDLDDKLAIVKLLMEINKTKKEGLENPENLMNKNISDQLKNLSITTIKQMLVVTDNDKDKSKIINEINNGLTPEESAYLSTLPTEQLLELIEETNKENK